MAPPDRDSAPAGRPRNTLEDGLHRLERAADAALRAPIGDVAWDQLANVVAAEHGGLGNSLGSETLDGMRNRVLADAECVRASLADARIPGRRAPAKQRRTVKFCRNMRSEIDKLSCALQEERPPDHADAARERAVAGRAR